MSDGQVDIRLREIIFHHDDKTPLPFLIELLHSVFKKQLADTFRFTEAVREAGKASCGSYPRDVADELLEAARQRIDEAGHPLRITSRTSAADDELLDSRCKLCGDLFGENSLSVKGGVALVGDGCMGKIMRQLPKAVREKQFGFACDALATHFAGIPLDRLVTTSRTFLGHMRADVQAGIDKLFSASPLRFFGIYDEHRYETLTFAGLNRDGRNAYAIAPAQYHEVDIGESVPVRCLDNGLWLRRAGKMRYAVVLSPHRDHRREFQAGAEYRIR